jgi:hypothetical protein
VRVKKYRYEFRKSFEMKFYGEIEARSEKDAEKKIRKFAKDCYPDEDPEDGYADVDSMNLDDGDDFCIYGGNK